MHRVSVGTVGRCGTAPPAGSAQFTGWVHNIAINEIWPQIQTRRQPEPTMTDEKKREDEISEEELEDVAGGAISVTGAAKGSSEAGAIPDVMQTPGGGGSGIPIPFPNSG